MSTRNSAVGTPNSHRAPNPMEDRVVHKFTRRQNRALHGSSCCGVFPCLPTHDQIALRAYQIYVANDCSKGRDDENWILAEWQLRQNTEVTPPALS